MLNVDVLLCVYLVSTVFFIRCQNEAHSSPLYTLLDFALLHYVSLSLSLLLVHDMLCSVYHIYVLCSMDY